MGRRCLALARIRCRYVWVNAAPSPVQPSSTPSMASSWPGLLSATWVLSLTTFRSHSRSPSTGLLPHRPRARHLRTGIGSGALARPTPSPTRCHELPLTTLRPPTKLQNATSSCMSGASSPQSLPTSPSHCHRLLQPLTARALRQSTRCSPASRKSPLPPTRCLVVCLKSPAPISSRTQVRHTSFIPTDSPAGWRLPSSPPPPPARPSARLLHGFVDLAYQPRYAPMWPTFQQSRFPHVFGSLECHARTLISALSPVKRPCGSKCEEGQTPLAQVSAWRGHHLHRLPTGTTRAPQHAWCFWSLPSPDSVWSFSALDCSGPSHQLCHWMVHRQRSARPACRRPSWRRHQHIQPQQQASRPSSAWRNRPRSGPANQVVGQDCHGYLDRSAPHVSRPPRKWPGSLAQPLLSSCHPVSSYFITCREPAESSDTSDHTPRRSGMRLRVWLCDIHSFVLAFFAFFTRFLADLSHSVSRGKGRW